MTNNHKRKVDLARKMAGKKNNTGIFLTNNWVKRKESISKGVNQKNKRIKKAIKIKKNRVFRKSRL